MTLNTPTFTSLSDAEAAQRLKARQDTLDDVISRLDETKLREIYQRTYGPRAPWPPSCSWSAGVAAALELLEPRNSEAASATQ